MMGTCHIGMKPCGLVGEDGDGMGMGWGEPLGLGLGVVMGSG